MYLDDIFALSLATPNDCPAKIVDAFELERLQWLCAVARLHRRSLDEQIKQWNLDPEDMRPYQSVRRWALAFHPTARQVWMKPDPCGDTCLNDLLHMTSMNFVSKSMAASLVSGTLSASLQSSFRHVQCSTDYGVYMLQWYRGQFSFVVTDLRFGEVTLLRNELLLPSLPCRSSASPMSSLPWHDWVPIPSSSLGTLGNRCLG